MSIRVVGYRDGHRIVVDEGPQEAKSHWSTYGTRNVSAVTGSNMVPMTSAAPSNPKDLERSRRNREAKSRQRARELAGDPRPNMQRCGKLLPVRQEPCARYAGHTAGQCRSRYALDNARELRHPTVRT